MIDSLARAAFLRMLTGFQGGVLRLVERDRSLTFGSGGDLEATLEVVDPRFYRRALLGGDVGLGEAYVDGDWSTPDLVALVRLAIRNVERVDGGGWLWSAVSRLADVVLHRLRRNTVEGSRRNIGEHYDLGNAFYALFLDSTLAYSCAYYRHADDSLESAQVQKYERICEKLQLTSGDHVLEIGTGWGGFAAHAARRHGCRVTTTTISHQQFEHARAHFDSLGEAGGRIQLLFDDYRNVRGSYDKLVSIEMFEAVGLEHYGDFFGACDALLKPDGIMLLQTITMNEQSFPGYHRRCDWIQKHVFPGGELASVSEILRCLGRKTQLGLFHAEDLGTHYARTLAAWRDRFHRRRTEVRALGFDERFLRLWDYYLAYCTAAFLERHIGDVQLLLTKPRITRALYGEPWVEREQRQAGVR